MTVLSGSLHRVRAGARSLWRGWERFWFEADGHEQLRLFRLIFGLLLFCFYLIRGLDLEFYFGEQGMLPLEVMRDTMPMEFRYSIFHHVTSDAALWVGHVIFLVSLLLLAFGIRARTFAVIAFVLHVSFLHRNMASAFGIDLISVFFLFYLCFVNVGSIRGETSPSAKTLTSVAFRLAQIQPCIIYACSGLEKMKGLHWWRGEAIWDVLANAQLARMDFSFMAHVPFLLVIATYVTLAWEIYFPVLVWLKPLRVPMLVIGVLLHVGIGFSINIPFFSALMMLTYVLFLTPRRAAQWYVRLSGWLPAKKNSSSPVLCR